MVRITPTMASLLPAVNQVYLCINNGIVEHTPKYRGGSANCVLLINETKISKRAFWITTSLIFATCNLLCSKDFYWQNLQHQKHLDGSLSPGTIPLTSVELLQHGIWPRSLYKALFICTMIQIFWYQESFSTEVSPHEICLVLRNISFTFLSNIIC